MNRVGIKPKGKVQIKWSARFAYAIGLLVTDGCLYSDGRHISLTSKDTDQLETFMKCLKINNKIGNIQNRKGQTAFRIQFGDVSFIRFLKNIGLTQAKSLTIGKINVPPKYFFDFLRGCFDGDGSSYSYWDPRWKSSFMFYIGFSSGSIDFITWIRKEINTKLKIKGHITSAKKKNKYYQLKYAKYEGVRLVREMYKRRKCICLKRKKLKINESLGTIGVPQIK